MGDITKDFSYHEFECGCGCGYCAVTFEQAGMLQRIRDRVGFPIIISSGCRCHDHNDAVGGSVNSDHLYGEGADIVIASSIERWAILEAAFHFKVPRIGAAKTFVHLGVCKQNPQKVLWTY